MHPRTDGWADTIIWSAVYTLAVTAVCAVVGALAVIIILFATRPAPAATSATFANELPVSCTVIRWFAIQFPPEQLEALARKYRLTREQRRQALACLKDNDGDH